MEDMLPRRPADSAVCLHANLLIGLACSLCRGGPAAFGRSEEAPSATGGVASYTAGKGTVRLRTASEEMGGKSEPSFYLQPIWEM